MSVGKFLELPVFLNLLFCAIGTGTRTFLIFRVADPVHFRPDPEPANQNVKIRIRIRILLALTKNQFKQLNSFHINQISSDI